MEGPKFRRGPKGGARRRKEEANKAVKDWRLKLAEDYQRNYLAAEEWRMIGLARAGDEVRNYEGALKAFTEAIALRPRQWRLYALRAEVFYELERWEDVVGDLNDAIRLRKKKRGGDAPRYLSQMQGLRAKVLVKLERLEEALEAYAEAIASAPRTVKYYVRRVNLFWRLEEYKRARKVLTQLIRFAPSAQYFQVRADCASKLGRLDAAIADCTEAIRLDAKCERAYWILGDCLILRRQWVQAALKYSHLIFLGVQGAVVYVSRALCYFEMGELERAIADCTTAINIDADCEAAYVQRAVCFGTEGKWAPSIADWSQAIRLDPAKARSFFARGSCYRESGDNLRAIEDISEAIRLAPRALHFKGRAQAYRNLGMTVEARDDERTAVEFG